jgi:SNF2 family DNA or RNA helicase
VQAMIRRTKDVVEKDIPAKRELKLLCPLSAEQIAFYKRILQRNMGLIDSGQQSSAAEWQKLSSLVMLLRQCSNHPYMLDGAEEVDLKGNILSETDSRIVSHSGKMVVLDKLIRKLLADSHRILLFSQFTTMLDILEVHRVPCSTHTVPLSLRPSSTSSRYAGYRVVLTQYPSVHDHARHPRGTQGTV